jgi:hypothetical protein
MSKEVRLYEPEDWMDVGDYLKHVANGRDPSSCSNELRLALAMQFANSPIFAIRNFFYTTDKEGEVVRQEPWAGQVILDLCIESQRKRNIAQAVVEIKPRQVGWTQHNIARAFWRCLQPGGAALVLVNDEDIAEKIMLRVNTIYNSLPKWMRPMKRMDNAKSLIFDNPNPKTRDELRGLASEFLCTVPSGIRGTTPRTFIWSEAAFCKDWEAVVDGVLNSMGAGPSFCRIIDTTPNGDDPFYKPLAMEAIERNPKWVKAWERKEVPTRQQIIDGILGEPDKPKAGWVPAFFPMQWHNQYTTLDESPEGQLPHLEDDEIKLIKDTLGRIDKYGGEEELDLINRWGMSLYRIAWRRWKIDNDTMGADINERLLTFRQEHATDYLSCFISHGKGAFDKTGMELLSRGIRAPLMAGCLRRDDKNRIYVDQTFQSDWIRLKFWATPSPHDEYVIGVDGSNAWYSSDGDSWYAQVLRRRDLKQVAVMKAKVPPDVVREQLGLLYHFFNQAYLGIEMEGSAIDVAYKLYTSGHNNQFFYKRYDMDPYKEPGQGLGWETNAKTRPTMQARLVEAIGFRDANGLVAPTLELRDDETYTQLRECSRDENGKIGNWDSGHDDAVMALMIADDLWRPVAIKQEKKDSPRMNPILKAMGAVPEMARPNDPITNFRSWARNHPEYDSL